MEMDTESLDEAARLLANLFINRMDVYAVQKSNGAYSKICQPVSAELLKRHLGGLITVGIYAVNPDHNTVRWICFDIDGRKIRNSEVTVKKIFQAATESFGRDAVLIEASGSPSSYHFWMFFLQPIPADVVRFLGERIMKRAMVDRSVELFPKQDRVDKNRFGNLIKLPLGLHQKAKKWSTFLDPETFASIDSVTALKQVVPVSVEEESLQRTKLEIDESKVPKRSSRTAGRLYRGVDPVCIRRLTDGVHLGNRDETAIRLAQYWHVEMGLSLKETLRKLLNWNLRNQPPMGKASDDPRNVEGYFREKIESAAKMTSRFGCASYFRLSKICSGREGCEYFRFRRRRIGKRLITIYR